MVDKVAQTGTPVRQYVPVGFDPALQREGLRKVMVRDIELNRNRVYEFHPHPRLVECGADCEVPMKVGDSGNSENKSSDST